MANIYAQFDNPQPQAQPQNPYAQFDQRTSPVAPAAPQPLSPEQQGERAGAAESPLLAAIGQASQQATLGGANYLNAAVHGTADWLRGNPQSFSDELAFQRGRSQGEIGAHKVAGTIGGVAGGLLPAGIGAAASLGKGVQAAKDVGWLRGLLKSAGLGAVWGGGTGAVQAYNQTGSPQAATVSGALGAITGAPLGAASHTIGTALQPASVKAAKLFSKIIGESPDDLQAAQHNFRLATSPDGNPTNGRAPSIAELMTLKQQGLLRAFAGGSPDLNAELTTAANKSPAYARQTIMNVVGDPTAGFDASASNKPLAESFTRLPKSGTPEALDTWVNREGDNEFGAIRKADVPLDKDQADTVRELIGSDLPMRRSFRKQVLDSLDAGKLNLGDADVLRRAFRNTNKAAPGQGFKERGEDFMDLLKPLSPEFGQAVDNFGVRSRIAEGAGLGNDILKGDQGLGFSDVVAGARPDVPRGVPVGARSAVLQSAMGDTPVTLAERLGADPGLARSLTTAVGPDQALQLSRAGDAEARAAQALRNVTHGPIAEPERPSPTQLLHGVATAMYHAPAAVSYHAAQFLNGHNARISPQTAKVLGKYLTTPGMADQAYAIMRKAGASDKVIGAFVKSLPAAAGKASATSQGQ